MNKPDISRYYADNIGLVHTVARKGYGRMQAIGAAIDYDDLVQDMSVVFIKAYELWDGDKGKFSTYFMYSAFNEINKVAKKFEIERVELRIKSVEEMTSSSDDQMDVSETIACGSDTPEQALEFKMMVAEALRGLSPVAHKMVEWLIDPPDELEREREARICHASLARDMGKNKRAKFSEIGLVCDVLLMAGVCEVEVRNARRELEAAVKRSRG